MGFIPGQRRNPNEINEIIQDFKIRSFKILAEGLDRGDVRVVNLSPRIKDVFDLTGFTSLFPMYDDLVDAVGSF